MIGKPEYGERYAMVYSCGILPVTGVILAGGGNTRMNASKAFLEVGGKRIIDRQLDVLGSVFAEVMVVTGSPAEYAGVRAGVVQDDDLFPLMRCPLRGVYTALVNASHPHCFVVGCDMPFISPALVAMLADMRDTADIVMPVKGGYPEPLFGVYAASVAETMGDALASGVRRLAEVFGRAETLYVDEAELRLYDRELYSFMNVNTPEELDAARAAATEIDQYRSCRAALIRTESG